MTLAGHKPSPGTAKATLTDVIQSRRAVVSVEEAGDVLSIGRCTAYEAAASGALPTIRCGRRLLVPVPRLMAMLGIPLPDDWLPVGASSGSEGTAPAPARGE